MENMRYKFQDKKEEKVFCDVHLLSRPGVGKERNVVKSELCYKQCEHLVVLDNRISNMEKVYEMYAKYEFVICTHGLGLDCHRTWEIFMLGGIVITKHSCMDYLYDDLPVVYVNDWKEVLDKSNLKKWRDEVKHLLTDKNILPKMKRNYWINEKKYNFNKE